MRVAQIIDSLGWGTPTTSGSSWGGAEQLQTTLVRALHQHPEVNLSIIALKESATPLVDQIRASNTPIYSFPEPRKLYDPERNFWLVDLLHRERFDLVQTHLVGGNTVGALAARAVGIPVVATLHSIWRPNQQKRLRDRLETALLRYGVQAVIAVGRQVAQTQQTRLAGRPVDIIYNAVAPVPPLPPAELDTLRAALEVHPGQLLCIAVGRLTEPKRYSDLLLAFALVCQSHPTAMLVIAGTGKEQAQLQALIMALQLEGQVQLLGQRGDIPQLLAASDLFVMSSAWEGTPVALLEAMMAGLPVVATRVGDIPHVVVETGPEAAATGILVPPRQPSQLAAAIRQLLDDPAQRQAMGYAGRARASCLYSLEAWGEQLVTLYQRVIAERAIRRGRCYAC